MNQTIMLVPLILDLLLTVGCIVLLLQQGHGVSRADFDRLQQTVLSELRDSRSEINTTQTNNLRSMHEAQAAALQQINAQQEMRLRSMQNTLSEQFGLIESRLNTSGQQNEQKLDNIRTTMEHRLTAMQQENTRSLDEMRQTVDEKLQKTLDEKLKRSFDSVSNQLEQVYKGLGEMKNLANGVGDLKKVLSNVKTRGILGEIQLGSILEEILSPEQYGRNVVTRPGKNEPVEFAIRLPGSGSDGDRPVWLPVDAKFPGDLYNHLMDAYDVGDPIAIETAGKELEQRIRGCAKDIHDKYVEPPYTTDFAILFLPTEGLYAEVIRRGMMERLQREFKVNIAGPSTMAALLNSLQMGFQTLAIQKRSSEVWSVLASVKTEFNTFADTLSKAQTHIKLVNDDLENLLGVRTRQMQRKLSKVQSLEGVPAPKALPTEEDSPLALAES